MELVLWAVLFIAHLHAVVGSCGRCNNIRVNLKCLDSDEAYSINATKGLACETISGKIVLQCEVEGLVNVQPSNFNYKSGTKDVAVFSAVTRPSSDLANSTLEVDSVSSDVVYFCEATVADMNGDSHVLRSNTLIVKKIAQDVSKITSPEQYSEKPMSGNSYITVLPCNVPTGWYPEPRIVWYKGGVELSPSVRVFPLEFDVGDYSRGSLIIHGYNSDEDRAEYRCNIHYVDYSEWLAAKKSGADTAKNTTAFEKNVTLTWINVKLGVVSASTENVYQDGIGRFDDGTYKTWGEPLNFTAVAIGGPIGNVMGTDRILYKWTIEGSELGLQKLNTTCVDEAKNVSSTKRREAETNTTETKTYTVEDYINYPSCLYWVTEDKTRTAELTNETMALLGIRQTGPNGNTLTLLHYTYGFDQSKFLAEMTYTSKTGSGGNVEVAAKTNTGNYQGINVVSGQTPPSDGNTCAYNEKSLVLPQSSTFHQKWMSAQYEPLADYPLLDACLYKNAALSGFKNDVTEVYNLAKLAENSVANKCQYYQVQRRNQRADNLWSYIYQTVLVETLGDQGEKADFKTEQFSAPQVTWTAGNVEDKTKKVTCSSSNSAKTGTLNWVELSSDCESYTLAAGVGDAETCGYSTALTFDMTTLSKNCTASCMSKSQCSETLVHNTTVQPIYCPVPEIANSTIYTTDDKVAPEKVLYTTVLKIACADGFQREGPDKITCQVDKSFSDNVTCVDLNIVTCPTLDAGFGTMSCNTSATPVSCTYTCPSDQFFELNSTTLSSTYEVTCNASNAEWSHMSSSNPLGDLPPCSEKTTPTSYSLAATVGLSGSDSCIDGLTAALRTALKSSDAAAYNCMDSGECSVPENAKCNSADGQLSLEFVVKQTGGDLSSSAIIDAFHTQLKADVAAKTFTLLVGSKKRKKRATTLTSDGNLASEAEAGCPSGSGTVGTSCIKCPIGQYEKDGVCTECAVNTYSDAVGSTSCTDCPNSLKTITTGADSESDCTVTCTIENLANGFRSPTTGYTVPEGTKITTFCNTNYSLEYNVGNKALCNASQPSCYEKCAIVSVDDKTSLKAGATFSYKEGLTYTCSNKADDEVFNLNCNTAGFKFDISCPTSYAAAIAGGVIGVLVVIAAIVVVRVIYIRTRPIPQETPPPLPTRNRGMPPPIPVQEEEVKPTLFSRAFGAPTEALTKVKNLV